MSLSGLGDRAHLFLNQRHNVDLRTRLATKVEEMATGEVGDMVAHLKGDTTPLADIDRRLALAGAYGSAAQEASNRLSLMQDALERVEGIRTGVLQDLMNPTVVGSRTIAANAARAGFEDIVSALNTRLGDSPLFAGTETGGPALAPPEAMMDDIRTAVAGSATAAEVAARLDAWFDDPTLGFASIGYQGADTDLTRAVDAGATVTLGLRADHATLRGLLKAAALGALAADPALSLPDGEGVELLGRSRDALLSLAAPLTEVRASLGQTQSRTEEVAARHAARATAWGLLRNEMTQTDPYAAASEIEALRTQLETHYELTSRLSSLSLLNHLR